MEDVAYPRLRELLEQDAQLVDVMSEKTYRKWHLPGAINLPLKELDRNTVSRLDRERPVVVYCHDSL
jgi:rhodanese-related sulfurtransferase